MEIDELAAEVSDLLQTGYDVWLSHKVAQAIHARGDQRRHLARETRLARLRELRGHLAQVQEVDKQIALIRATPQLPNQAVYLRRLEQLRKQLLRRKDST